MGLLLQTCCNSTFVCLPLGAHPTTIGGRSFEARCIKMCTEPCGFRRMLRRHHGACRLFCKKIHCKNSTFQVKYVKGLGFYRLTMRLWTFSGAFLFLWRNYSVQHFTFKSAKYMISSEKRIVDVISKTGLIATLPRNPSLFPV